MTAHAKLSASGSARWLACPGSVAAERGIADSSSPAAQEGTAAHELGELVLIGGGNCEDWLGKQLPENNEWVVTQEMADAVQVYVDYVRNLGGEQAYEIRVDFSDWVPEGFGTSDAIVITNEDDVCVLNICDLKYGKGIRVDAEDNSQGLLYALGAYNDYAMFYDIKRVVIAIVQPRLDHISEWGISTADLLKWGEWASSRADMCLEPEAVRVAGEKQCQWCKAQAKCPAQKQHAERIAMVDFDDVSEQKPVNTLTDDELRKALEGKKLVLSWLDAVEKLVVERLSAGEGFDGFKLVAGRSVRQWGNEAEAEKALADMLGDNAYTKKLLSPAQAEKSLGKAKAKDIAEYVVKAEGKPTLAPESDKRKAVNITANDFD